MDRLGDQIGGSQEGWGAECRREGLPASGRFLQQFKGHEHSVGMRVTETHRVLEGHSSEGLEDIFMD